MKHVLKVIALSLLVAALSVVAIIGIIGLAIFLVYGFVAIIAWGGWMGVAFVVGIIIFGIAAFQIEMNLRNGYEWNYTGTRE